MLKQLIRSRLDAAERDLHYDMSYLRDVLDTDLSAFFKFFRVTGMSNYRHHEVPLDAWYAAKLASAMCSDCGPCSQLMVTMAERAGVTAETLRAVASFDDAALSSDVRLSVQFVRAVLRHDLEADPLREQVVARWGRRGLVTLAFAAVSSGLYPTLKYAMGYGRACSRLEVAGKPIDVKARLVA